MGGLTNKAKEVCDIQRGLLSCLPCVTKHGKRDCAHISDESRLWEYLLREFDEIEYKMESC